MHGKMFTVRVIDFLFLEKRLNLWISFLHFSTTIVVSIRKIKSTIEK
jgi:hypothetical protein